jgi:valyl-tRNA synthetase
MPFITEAIYQALPHEGPAIMVEKYPEYSEALSFPKEEADFEAIMTAVRAVRQRRSEMNVPPSKRPQLFIVTDKTAVFEAGRIYLSKLAFAGELTITSDAAAVDTAGCVTVVTNDAKLYMPLAELVDIEKERARITKELEKARANLAGLLKKLENEAFVSKAPEAVVNAEREKAEKTRALIENLEESLKELS